MTQGKGARLAGTDEVPHAAFLQVQLGDAEPVIGRGKGLEPLVPGPAGQEDAVALGLPPADPAPQLVELGQPEPLGMLDHHDARVGDVDPHLDDGRRDQDLDLSLPEPPHDAVPLVALEPPVHQADLQLRPFAR